jgi:hypothetical protein
MTPANLLATAGFLVAAYIVGEQLAAAWYAEWVMGVGR